MHKRLPCLRLLTPSAGSGEGALSLTEDMAGVPLTSFVQIGHDSALFESPTPVTSRHHGRTPKRLPRIMRQTTQSKKQKCREVEGTAGSGLWWRLTWMRRNRLCKEGPNSYHRVIFLLGNCVRFDISYSRSMQEVFIFS